MAAKKKTAAPKKVSVPSPKNGVQYTQGEFYECMRNVCDLASRRAAQDVYSAFAGMVQAALKKGYKVPLPGIGKIQVRRSSARTGRNPMTGETINIPAKKRVKLTASKAFKEAVL